MQNGASDDSSLVSDFFSALEKYDFQLFEAGRFSQPVSDNAPELLQATLQALDR